MAEQNYTEEIDLSYLTRKFNELFKKSIRGLFMIFSFFIRYWVVVLILVIIGIGYGYYKDSKAKMSYRNEAIVIPNFESIDYLYSTIEELNNRRKGKDSIQLKEILGKEYPSLQNIEIEPISDIKTIVSQSRDQMETMRILYQSGELNNLKDNLKAGKLFKYHKITFIVSGENKSKEISDNLFAYLNSNPHFKNYRDIYIENNNFQIVEYKKLISEVDSIMKSISISNKVQSAGVNISENSDLHLLIAQKQNLLNGLLRLQVNHTDYESPIKVVSIGYDIEVRRIPNIMKYPFLLVGLFGFIFLLRYLYKRFKEISTEPANVTN